MQNNFQDIKTLIDLLKSKYKGIDEVIIYNYITELLKNGFLISNLRLSTLNERNIDNLIDVLKIYGNQLKASVINTAS